MNLGYLGAVLGGVVGAVVWALIGRFLSMESGLVSWAIGILIGFGSLLLGGRGVMNGVFCAVICALAIFAGKTLADYTSVDWGQVRTALRKDERNRFVPDERIDKVVQQVKANAIARSVDRVRAHLDAADVLMIGFGAYFAFMVGSGRKNQRATQTAQPRLTGDGAPVIPEE